MKKYTPLDGLRWSRNSDSALNNMPQTDVLGRAGVFGMDDYQKKFRVCANCMSYVSTVNANITELSCKMKKIQTILQSIKIGVRPIDCFTNIQPQIIL